eukprot:gene4637-14833_t
MSSFEAGGPAAAAPAVAPSMAPTQEEKKPRSGCSQKRKEDLLFVGRAKNQRVGELREADEGSQDGEKQDLSHLQKYHLSLGVWMKRGGPPEGMDMTGTNSLKNRNAGTLRAAKLWANKPPLFLIRNPMKVNYISVYQCNDLYSTGQSAVDGPLVALWTSDEQEAVKNMLSDLLKVGRVSTKIRTALLFTYKLVKEGATAEIAGKETSALDNAMFELMGLVPSGLADVGTAPATKDGADTLLAPEAALLAKESRVTGGAVDERAPEEGPPNDVDTAQANKDGADRLLAKESRVTGGLAKESRVTGGADDEPDNDILPSSADESIVTADKVGRKLIKKEKSYRPWIAAFFVTYGLQANMSTARDEFWSSDPSIVRNDPLFEQKWASVWKKSMKADLWQADLLALVETKQRFDALDPHKPGDTELALNLVDEWSAEYANLKSLLQSDPTLN